MAGRDGRWNTGCAFLDYDRDGWADLFVANYVDLGLDLSNLPLPGSGQFCQYKGIPLACGPRGLNKAVNYLYRNNRDGTFSDQSDAAGIRQTEGHYALGVLPFDFNRDGWSDIYVAVIRPPASFTRIIRTELSRCWILLELPSMKMAKLKLVWAWRRRTTITWSFRSGEETSRCGESLP